MKPSKSKTKEKEKSLDILYLESKLVKYVKEEEYEKAAVIKRWITELSEKEQ